MQHLVGIPCHNVGVTYGAQDKGGRRPTPLESHEKQRFLEWLLTPSSEREPSKMEDLAAELGVTRRTLTKWKTEDKEFMEAWEARYLATIGSPEKKQKLLSVLEKTGSDQDDPKHVQAIKAYFDIVEGLRPQKMQLEVTRSPIDLTDEQLAEVFAAKVMQRTAVAEDDEQPTAEAMVQTVPGEAIEDGDLSCEAYGTIVYPPGMTQEEAERLVREADERRRQEQEI